MPDSTAATTAIPNTPGTMLPRDDVLTDVLPTDRLTERGMLLSDLRQEFRRVPNGRNVLTMLSVYAQTIGVLAIAFLWGNPIGYVVAFLLMGRTQVQFAILMHEAAHRLLFSNRRVNDWVGKWLLAGPVFVPIDLYRRAHMAHHREEFGPNEPDLPLYRGYPIPRDSFRRKLWRDLRGSTGIRLMKPLLAGAFSRDSRRRRIAWQILACQIVIFAIFALAGFWWGYFVFWLLAHLTLWRVLNRLRAIAEHGGLKASPDRRVTTHSIRQHPVARFVLVPYKTGWHLAHHVDAGIPCWNLPRFHEELRRAGYVTDELEWPDYRTLWREMASG